MLNYSSKRSKPCTRHAISMPPNFIRGLDLRSLGCWYRQWWIEKILLSVKHLLLTRPHLSASIQIQAPKDRVRQSILDFTTNWVFRPILSRTINFQGNLRHSQKLLTKWYRWQDLRYTNKNCLSLQESHHGTRNLRKDKNQKTGETRISRKRFLLRNKNSQSWPQSFSRSEEVLKSWLLRIRLILHWFLLSIRRDCIFCKWLV